MATITDRRGYHILNWTDPQNGKRRRQSLGKIGTIPATDLRDLLRIKNYELSTGARLLNVHRRPAPRFDAFAHDYLIWHQGEFPDSNYRVAQIIHDHLVPYFGLDPLNLISLEKGEAYKTTRRPLVRASTLEKEIRVLHAVLNRAVALKRITDNPLELLQAPKILDSKPHIWYSKAQLARLYKQSTYWPVWKLFANTGMRRGEGLILRWLWVTGANIRLQSTDEERTKDGEWRSIPKSAGAVGALAALDKRGPYVLPRMRKESLSRAFLRDARAAGLPGSLHALRHTYICHLLLEGVPIRTVQLYAGHEHVTTTENYAYQVLKIAPAAARKLAI